MKWNKIKRQENRLAALFYPSVRSLVHLFFVEQHRVSEWVLLEGRNEEDGRSKNVSLSLPPSSSSAVIQSLSQSPRRRFLAGCCSKKKIQQLVSVRHAWRKDDFFHHLTKLLNNFFKFHIVDWFVWDFVKALVIHPLRSIGAKT